MSKIEMEQGLLSVNEIDRRMVESHQLKNSKGSLVSVNAAMTENKEAILRATWKNQEIMEFRESFLRKNKVDFADGKKFPVKERDFSWNKAAQKCGHSSVKAAFREADSGSNFPGVLRAGVQSIVNSMYLTVPTTYESWTSTVTSSKDTELYAPLQGISFLREVGKKEQYGESGAAGLDIKLVNRKYGTIFAVEKELLEDDQTGQFAKQASLLGEYAKLAMEVIVYAKLAGNFANGNFASYSQMTVPHTETKETFEVNGYPFASKAAGGLFGGGFNRPDAFGLLNQANIQTGFIGLMNQLNILGLKMSVDPDTIIIGPKFRFDLAVLLNSSFYPSVPSATPGATGANFGINPIESIAKAVISRFMFDNNGLVTGSSSAWYICDSKKPFFTVQLREAAAVEQETPTSGQSFDRDIVRFRVSTRGNADYIDPRFIWQGSDGSV